MIETVSMMIQYIQFDRIFSATMKVASILKAVVEASIKGMAAPKKRQNKPKSMVIKIPAPIMRKCTLDRIVLIERLSSGLRWDHVLHP